MQFYLDESYTTYKKCLYFMFWFYNFVLPWIVDRVKKKKNRIFIFVEKVY